MSDSFYHITEPSKLDKRKIGSKNLVDHVSRPCLGIFAYEYTGTVLRPMTPLNLISHVCETIKIHNGDIKSETKVVM